MNVVEVLLGRRDPAPLPFLDGAALLAEDDDDQLSAHGPEGDGAISVVGAEGQGIELEELPEAGVHVEVYAAEELPES